MLQAIPAKQPRITGIEVKEDGLHFSTEHGRIIVQAFGPGIIRIFHTLDEDAFTACSPGIIARPLPRVLTWTESESVISVRTELLRLEIDRHTAAFAWYDADGTLLVREPARGGKQLIPYDSYKPAADAEKQVEKIETPDGVKEVVHYSKMEFDKVLYHSRLAFEWREGEALYGLGQQEEGTLNLRGSRQYIHQANMKIAMPLMLSTGGYGVLFDTGSPLIFNDNAYGSYLYNESCRALSYFFIKGDTFDRIISGYRLLSGTAAMLPRWAFGYIQSRERYETQQEILDTAQEFRRREIPLDCLVLDWQSWEPGMWGQKTFDAERFPDPAAMIDQLHRDGVHFMISVWPNMHAATENYREMRENRALLPHSEIYNAPDREARTLYWKQAEAGLFSKGVDAWWCDSSEPFSPEWNANIKPEPDRNLYEFHSTAAKYLPEENTNTYSLFHSRAIYEGQRGVTDEKRVVNLTRSGYTGQQRYGTIVWSGDISADWKTLRRQIAAGLNLCASGLPYWTLDIGAFFVKKGAKWFWNGDFEAGCEDLGYRELYTRWLQLGAFLPVFRSHGTDTPREIWHFGEKGDRFYEIIAEYIRLRYRLLPYIYSTAAMVTREHRTVMRLLAFDFPNDGNTHDTDDQFMFGPSLMACPVTEPMYYAPGSVPLSGVARTRKVYLPAGHCWYDFRTNEKLSGGRNLTAEAPLETMPLYVKGGSIIPMGEGGQHSGDCADDTLTLHIYPGADATFTLYQDENDNYNYETGACSLIEIHWDDVSGTLTLGDRTGAFDAMPSVIQFRVILAGEERAQFEYNGVRTSQKIRNT